jgi:hypothetical protein
MGLIWRPTGPICCTVCNVDLAARAGERGAGRRSGHGAAGPDTPPTETTQVRVAPTETTQVTVAGVAPDEPGD